MVKVSWADTTCTIIQLDFERGWTWDDLRAAVEETDRMVASQQHIVHLIIDLRSGGGLPRNFISAAGDLFASGEARSNEGQRIVIGAGALMRTAYRGLLNVYGTHLKNRPFTFADTLEEAYRLLKPVL